MPETFAAFFIMGLLFGILYDFMRFFRMLFPGKAAVFFIDFLFFVIVSNVFFILLLGYNNGQMRMLYFLMTAFGFLVYIFTIFKLTEGFQKFISSHLRRFIKNRLKSFKKVLQFVKRVYYNIFKTKKRKNAGDKNESTASDFKTE